MGYHLCITNEDVVLASIEKGIYGNVWTANESLNITWGKIRDLYAVKPKDLILLYVKSPGSYFYGVFEVTSLPYICYDNKFNSVDQKYPFRFDFKTVLHFPKPVPAFEFYSLIERGKIDSNISLSRDVNSSYRGIRQLFKSEFEELLNLFFKYNPKTNPNNFEKTTTIVEKFLKMEATEFNSEKIKNIVSKTSIVFNKIPAKNNGSAILENVLHAYIAYNLLHNLNNVREDLQLTNFNELILEAPVFKSMQYRSDILATYTRNDKAYFFSFVELKKDNKVGIDEVAQLVGYLKSFSSSKALPINSIEGIFISNRFDLELIDYLNKRIKVEKENIISLIKYNISIDNKVHLEKIV